MSGATKSAMVRHSSSILCHVYDWQARHALLKIKWSLFTSQVRNLFADGVHFCFHICKGY